MSQSDESVSPAVSSAGFSTFAEAKFSLEATLASYQELNTGDDTKKFLEICFKYFPPDGQVNFSEDVCGCRDDSELRQLAASIDTGLLRPFLSKGKTPAIKPAPRADFRDSVENLLFHNFSPATRTVQESLRRNCLMRDGYRCAISKTWSSGHEFPSGEPDGVVQAAHIIPFALGRFKSNDERQHTSKVWVNIFRYFPALGALNLSPDDVNRENNMMSLITPLYEEFGRFHFVLEATLTPNWYRLKHFPRFASVYRFLLPRDGIVTLTNYDHDHHLPEPLYLKLHAAIGNILHASGRAERIENLLRDLRETDGLVLAKDGSTNVGDLLSVSRLSLLASD